MARVLVGVSGGIAAYKAVELVRLLGRAGHSVRAVQTPSSLNFVGRATFEGITGRPCSSRSGSPIPPGGRSRGAGARPRSDLAPRAGAPLRRLRDRAGLGEHAGQTGHRAGRQPAHERGARVHEPAGPRARHERADVGAPGHAGQRSHAGRTRGCGGRAGDRGARVPGEWGSGRLAEPAALSPAVEGVLGQHQAARSLEGVRVLVTAGGTREPIDAVRYVGNRSSGRMGFALAREAVRRGARVTVVAANVGLPRQATASSTCTWRAQRISRRRRARASPRRRC